MQERLFLSREAAQLSQLLNLVRGLVKVLLFAKKISKIHNVFLVI
jgi:hypothetical protein